jgi:hypothetical protein
MSEDTPKIHVDSDWKAEAQREKERLAKEAEKQRQHTPVPDPSFAELINMIAMQAVIGLGGFQSPDGQRIPPDPDLAKHHIDMLDVLSKKTAGNLTPEEKQALDRVLYELRMRFVEMVSRPGQAPPGAGPRPAPKKPVA